MINYVPNRLNSSLFSFLFKCNIPQLLEIDLGFKVFNFLNSAGCTSLGQDLLV